MRIKLILIHETFFFQIPISSRSKIEKYHNNRSASFVPRESGFNSSDKIKDSRGEGNEKKDVNYFPSGITVSPIFPLVLANEGCKNNARSFCV